MNRLRKDLLVGTFLISILLRAPAQTGNLDVWQWLNPIPTANLVNGATVLNGRFVTCSGPRIFASPDGTNWTTYLVPGNPSLTQVGFGNGLYVAVGSLTNFGVIFTSTNLTDWTFHSPGTTNLLNAVTFGGAFVVVGEQGTLLSSTNGSDWALRDPGTSNPLRSVASGNGYYIASALYDTSVSVSIDGSTWWRQLVGTDYDYYSVTFLQGRFYIGGRKPNLGAPGQRQTLYFSYDTTNWIATTQDLTLFNPVTEVFSNGTNYFARVGDSGLMSSMDGTNFHYIWTGNCPAFGGPYSFAYCNGTFIGADSTIWLSKDGTNWSRTGGSQRDLSDIAHGNGVTVAVGAAGGALISSNGLPFTDEPLPTAQWFSEICFANGIFHCVGGGGTLLRSTNGVDWVQRNSSTVEDLLGLCYENGLWVAVGRNGTVVTSPTGQAWTLRFSGTGSSLQAITYGNGTYTAAGDLGTIITSPDAVSWTVQFSDTLAGLNDVTYAMGKFVAVGTGGTIITSIDGVNWTTCNSGTANALYSIAFNDGTFIAVGAANVLVVSTNGIDWSAQDCGTAVTLNSARPYKHGFILAGQLGTILQNSAPADIGLNGTWDAAASVFTLNITLALGQSFTVQSCDSLASGAWTNRVSFQNAPSSLAFPDLSSSNQPARFYRIKGQ